MTKALYEAVRKLADEWEADAENMGELIPEGEVLEHVAEQLRGLIETYTSLEDSLQRRIATAFESWGQAWFSDDSGDILARVAAIEAARLIVEREAPCPLAHDAESPAGVTWAAKAADMCARGEADWLVVLDVDDPQIPGEQGDDGIRAVAAIDALRFLVETYDDLEGAE